MRKKSIALALAGTIALGACADATTEDTTDGLTDDTPAATTAPAGTDASGGMEAIAELQAEIDELANAISESESAQDLTAAWETLNTELAASIEAIQEDGTIAREEIESGLETFEQRLDELEVEENVRTAWEALRSHLEQIMT